jgi:hypothetical protein
VRLSINISARDMLPDLVPRVLAHTAGARLPLSSVELEVTETALMADTQAAGHVLQRLRNAGVGVALDDFGTGYSSLTYLRNLPLTNIKIDRGFVQHITSRSNDLAITQAVVDLGRTIGVRTTAEGIETPEQLALLLAAGCPTGQGWLWSEALPPAGLAALVQRHPHGFRTPAVQGAEATTPRPRAVPVPRSNGLHRMLHLHAQGASLTAIAAVLNDERYRTVDGRPWHPAGVAQVIADNAPTSNRSPLPKAAEKTRGS